MSAVLTDVRYAMGQLRRGLGDFGAESADTMQRALDALERVEAELARKKTPDEIEAEYERMQREDCEAVA